MGASARVPIAGGQDCLPMTRALCLTILLGAACTCRSGKPTGIGDGQLVATPLAVTFTAVYVGQDVKASVRVVNVGGAKVAAPLSSVAPFSTEVTSIELGRGESQGVEVHFAPSAAGHFEGSLKIGALDIQLSGDSLDVPQCAVTSVCSDGCFDFQTAQCTSTNKPEGASCSTRCVANGSCGATGECLGVFASCDDRNACTIDACSETGGCQNLPRTCPAPSNPCQVASCDAMTGCGVEDKLDGTLCGPDVCEDADVKVCVSGPSPDAFG